MLVSVLAWMWVPVTGWAQEPEPVLTEESDAAVPAAPSGQTDEAGGTVAGTMVASDNDFGPLLTIEDVEITGNRETPARLILRALPVAAGERLRAGDVRLREARFALLSTGYFRQVNIDLRKGSERGAVVVLVTVEERGTMIVDGLYFGTSDASRWWAGAAISDRNAFGTGLAVGVEGIFADTADVENGRDQWAMTLRVADPLAVGNRLGAHGELMYARAGEPYRLRAGNENLADDPDSGTAPFYGARRYDRLGAHAGVGVDLSSQLHLSANGRVERISNQDPSGEGVEASTLDAGTSWLVGASVALDYDTRPDPVLPYTGQHAAILAQGALGAIGSDYDFAVILARYGRWWPSPSRRHVISLQLSGGVVFGTAPRFERLHVADFDRLLSPRILGLLVSTNTAPDIFATGADAVTYGRVGASVAVEYSLRLFRGRNRIYGGDLFAGIGLWTLDGDRLDRDTAEPGASVDDVVVDGMIDAGLRLDTEIGIFELTFANALGRVPLP